MELSQAMSRARAQLGLGAVYRLGGGSTNPRSRTCLDEQRSAMDLVHIGLAMDRLGEIAGDVATVIIAIHDIALAAAFADDAWLLRDGRLVEAGATGAVLTPGRLRDVLGVGFHRVEVGDGAAVMVPETWIDREDGAGRDR